MIAHIARMNINHLLKLLVRNSIAGLKRSMTKKTTNIVPIIILEWAKNPQIALFILHKIQVLPTFSSEDK